MEGPAVGDSRGAGGATWRRRHQDRHDDGVVHRALRADLEDLRSDLQRGLRGLRDDLTADIGRHTGELAGHLAEVLPKVGDLEDRLTALEHGPGRRGLGEPTGQSGPADAPPPRTPAAGWDQMDRPSAEAAWHALAGFVDTVLDRQYQLSRLQVPDCWAVHPRVIREIAWLRGSYLEARDQEHEADAASMSWHVRALPSFIANVADAVDLRECRPGVHRLTEPEIDACLPELTAAHAAGKPAPAPSAEIGPDRPRLRPEHFPTRRTGPNRGAAATTAGPRAPSVEDLTADKLLIDACHRDYWVATYREARAADLAGRPD